MLNNGNQTFIREDKQSKAKALRPKIAKIAIVAIVLLATLGSGIAFRWWQLRDQSPPAIPLTENLPEAVAKSQDLAIGGDYEAAQKALAEELATTTDNEAKYSLYLQEGLNSKNAGKYDEAIESYKKAEAVKKTTGLYSAMARAYESKGDKAKAIEYYKKALALIDPKTTMAEVNKQEIQQEIKELGG